MANGAPTLKEAVRVDWSLAYAVAIFFDFIEFLLGFVGVGVFVNTVLGLITASLIWLILKKGKVPQPFKDIRGTAIGSAIPIYNIVQFWTYRVYKLSQMYKKANLELRKKQVTLNAATAQKPTTPAEIAPSVNRESYRDEVIESNSAPRRASMLDIRPSAILN